MCPHSDKPQGYNAMLVALCIAQRREVRGYPLRRAAIQNAAMSREQTNRA